MELYWSTADTGVLIGKEQTMDYIHAFWVGGLICVLVQILIENTKLMPGRIMVILVVTGVFLGAFGIFPYLKEYAGAGVTVPLLGFGNNLWEGVKKPWMKTAFSDYSKVVLRQRRWAPRRH